MHHGGHTFTGAPTDNPYNVDHGYGITLQLSSSLYPNRQYYTNTRGPTPDAGAIGGLSMEMVIIIALVVVIVIVLIAFGVFAMRKK